LCHNGAKQRCGIRVNHQKYSPFPLYFLLQAKINTKVWHIIALPPSAKPFDQAGIYEPPLEIIQEAGSDI
jgi:hypothetical protein